MRFCPLRAALALVLACGLASTTVQAGPQLSPSPAPGTATATIAAGTRYQAGWLRRFFLGDTYRDLWTVPIEIPVLDLSSFAGGLTPTKTGGGNQTRSLRFEDSLGNEFVFRMVDKAGLAVSAGYEHTIVEGMTRDQVSAHHPAGAVVADGLLSAAGVSHPSPALFVMPDDARLGKYRAEFAGQLGMVEAFPAKSDKTGRFAGATAIIDSDSLQVLLDSDPKEQVDSQAYLTARLMDMFLNDWDRHAGNWKWGRTVPGAVWRPIARDRDKVMIGYGGVVGAARVMVPNLVRFEATYPSLRALTYNSLELDRRLLSGMEAAVFDSIATFLAGRLSDPVIDAALLTMPSEYHATLPIAAAKLKSRRDLLPAQAQRFYRFLATVVDLHATDAADRATITLVDDRHLDVQLRSGDKAPHFQQRFDARDTHEIRLYLHGGDDQAVVRGDAAAAIPFRIIGGNGANQLSDSSSFAGQSGAVRLYDQGAVRGIEYGPDAVFDRRPWPRLWGKVQTPGRDFGTSTSPVLGLRAPGDLGLLLRLGVNREHYGFRKYPYANRAALTGEYSTGIDAWRVTGLVDKRREASSIHLTAMAQMSEIEVLNFHGLGNDTPGDPEQYFEARQRQWLLQPAVAFALGPRSDLFLAPVIQYATSYGGSGGYLSTRQPYGFGDFGQAGLRLGLHSDSRNRSKEHSRGLLFDVSATAFPAVWDVASSFGVLAGTTGGYYTLRVPLRPVLVLRAGAKKIYGEFPFHEAAFIGGRASVRGLDRERYAGDAAISGTAELQISLARFPLVLPLEIGVYGYGDAGRVYVDGESPGGWHETTGVGFWIGILNPANALSLEFPQGRSGFRVRTGLTF